MKDGQSDWRIERWTEWLKNWKMDRVIAEMKYGRVIEELKDGQRDWRIERWTEKSKNWKMERVIAELKNGQRDWRIEKWTDWLQNWKMDREIEELKNGQRDWRIEGWTEWLKNWRMDSPLDMDTVKRDLKDWQKGQKWYSLTKDIHFSIVYPLTVPGLLLIKLKSLFLLRFSGPVTGYWKKKEMDGLYSNDTTDTDNNTYWYW